MKIKNKIYNYRVPGSGIWGGVVSEVWGVAGFRIRCVRVFWVYGVYGWGFVFGGSGSQGLGLESWVSGLMSMETQF